MSTHHLKVRTNKSVFFALLFNHQFVKSRLKPTQLLTQYALVKTTVHTTEVAVNPFLMCAHSLIHS